MSCSVKGIKEWLWVVANSEFCLFTAADTRSRAELKTILATKYKGVLSSDDFKEAIEAWKSGGAQMPKVLFTGSDSNSSIPFLFNLGNVQDAAISNE